jgi:hypothetical protein
VAGAVAQQEQGGTYSGAFRRETALKPRQRTIFAGFGKKPPQYPDKSDNTGNEKTPANNVSHDNENDM